MYGMFTYIYHKSEPHVGKYTIWTVHSVFGNDFFTWNSGKRWIPSHSLILAMAFCAFLLPFLKLKTQPSLPKATCNWTRSLCIDFCPHTFLSVELTFILYLILLKGLLNAVSQLGPDEFAIGHGTPRWDFNQDERYGNSATRWNRKNTRRSPKPVTVWGF